MKASPKLMLEIPANCNDYCVFCSLWNRAKTVFPEWEVFRRQVALYHKKGGTGTVIRLGGGEPLFSIDDFRAFLKNLMVYGQKISFCTNGKNLHLLNNKDFKGIENIGISLLSHKKECFNALKPQSSYDGIIKNIEKARKWENRPPIFLLTLINAVTVGHLDEFADFAENLGFSWGIEVQDKDFTTFDIQDKIKWLFDFDLNTLEKQLVLLQKRNKNKMSDKYLSAILKYYCAIQNNNYRVNKAPEPLCHAKFVRVCENGTLNCPSNGLSQIITEFKDYFKAVENCMESCGVKSCDTRLIESF